MREWIDECRCIFTRAYLYMTPDMYMHVQYLPFHAVAYATRVGRGAGDFGNAKESKVIYCQRARVVKS